MVGYKFCANLHKIFELYTNNNKKVKPTPIFFVVDGLYCMLKTLLYRARGNLASVLVVGVALMHHATMILHRVKGGL